MMYQLKTVFFILLSVCSFVKVFSQDAKSLRKETEETVKFDRFSNRPELGADFSNIAELKIFIRKDDYAFREMIILDVAMLTSPKVEYYFIDLFGVEVRVKDKLGNDVSVYPFLITSRRFSPTILKGGLQSQSFYLIVGCQKEKYEIPDDLENAGDKRVIFDNNLFMTFGDACLDFKKNGVYEIFAEISNDLVVVPKNQEIIKTAVGKIKSSNTLKIKVEK